MQTPNGKNIDNYWNRYDSSKEYREILFRDGYGTQASEINELESITAAHVRGIGDAIFSDGDIIKDAQISVDASSGAVTAEAGQVYLAGTVYSVSASAFTVPLQGTFSVGIRLKETIISEAEDAGLLNPAVGSRGRVSREHGAAEFRLYGVMTETGALDPSIPSIPLMMALLGQRRHLLTSTASPRASPDTTGTAPEAAPTSAPA